MGPEKWTEVDSYISGLFIDRDPALESALAASAQSGLPAIHVSPAQGKLLHLLARATRAKKILEIGTLGGYSTIWLARALPPGGQIISLELKPEHAEVARSNLKRAGVHGVTEIRIGPAVTTLAQLVEEGQGPFDLIFIDADKPAYSEYLGWSLKLGRKGTLIIADNVVRKGEVVNPMSKDANVQGIRRFNERLAAEKNVCTTTIQTVGSKGYDGLALILVAGEP